MNRLSVIEARLSKMERIKQAFEQIQANETLTEFYKEHLHQHKLARVRYDQGRA